MSRPDAATFGAIAALAGVPLPEAVLHATVAASEASWDGIEAMRAVPLSLVDAIEPAHAVTRLSNRRTRR